MAAVKPPAGISIVTLATTRGYDMNDSTRTPACHFARRIALELEGKDGYNTKTKYDQTEKDPHLPYTQPTFQIASLN